MTVVYYSQEDPRWRNKPYTIDGDADETIGTSGCGPTSFAMVASTYLGKEILPTEACQYAIKKGYRTANNGTAWSYFKNISDAYGLQCIQTGSLGAVNVALQEGKLVIASMGKGHFTGSGHFILLVGSKDGWIEVYDPNHDNNRYGSDGLIDQGTRNDGKVKARESVFRSEAKQYWIIYKESEEEVTREEYEALIKRIEKLEHHVNISGNQEPPEWAFEAIGAAKASGAITTSNDKGTPEIKVIQMLYNLGIFKK